MNRLKSTTSVPVALLALVLATVAATGCAAPGESAGLITSPGALEGPAPRPSQATTIATVDLTAVLEGLTQRADADLRLRQMAEESRTESDRRAGEIEALRAQFRDTVVPATRQDLEERLALAAIEYGAWVRLTNQKTDVEQSLVLQDLYRSIKLAAAEMARAEGYDLVIVDDSVRQLRLSLDSPLSREEQIRQQIGARRLLFAAPELNVTDDLIARMNRAYQASGGRP